MLSAFTLGPFFGWLSENVESAGIPFMNENKCSDRQGFGSGSGSGVFAWIRIRFSNFLDPDLDPVSAKILENCRKVSKSDLSEENLKFMTKDRQKMKKATISY